MAAMGSASIAARRAAMTSGSSAGRSSRSRSARCLTAGAEGSSSHGSGSDRSLPGQSPGARVGDAASSIVIAPLLWVVLQSRRTGTTWRGPSGPMRNAGRRRLTATSSDWAPRQYTAGVVEDAAFPERSVRPRLWLVRHGETEWARMERHTGATDIPLTEAGRAQAEAVARRLAGIPFAAVRSSPRSRALDTARLAGFSDRVETDEDLVEWDYGADEGRATEEVRAERPGWTIWRNGVRGGEGIEGGGRWGGWRPEPIVSSPARGASTATP